MQAIHAGIHGYLVMREIEQWRDCVVMFIAQVIAFSALVLASALLEINGKNADGLWVLVVLWIIGGTWNTNKEGDK